MKAPGFETMPIDDLWALHEEIGGLLAEKLAREKQVLEQRLAQLREDRKVKGNGAKGVRRPYPKVVPKYQNPASPNETWSGRGKQPRWLTALLKSGKRIEDFRIRARGPRGRAAPVPG
jgi:DNA-binding protein H-NS